MKKKVFILALGLMMTFGAIGQQGSPMVTDPDASEMPTDATIAVEDILYWVGTGPNQTVLAVNWTDTALAWGYRWDGNKTVGEMIADIAAADPRFSYNTSNTYVENIFFNDCGISLAGDDFWVSFSNGVFDDGTLQILTDGDFIRWAEFSTGVPVDSNWVEDYGGFWSYVYAFPMTVHPVSVPIYINTEISLDSPDIVFPNQPAVFTLNTPINSIIEGSFWVLWDSSYSVDNIYIADSGITFTLTFSTTGTYQVVTGVRKSFCLDTINYGLSTEVRVVNGFVIDSIAYLINDYDTTTVTVFYCCNKNIDSLSIPSTVTHNNNIYTVTNIRDSVFMDIVSLRSVSIPSTIENIGAYAFSGSSITEITIPAQVSSIGCCAFSNCEALTTVNYYSVNCEYLYEGEMDSDKALFAGDSNITTLNIGSTVRRIPALSFTGIGIDTLDLHDSILYVGKHAFSMCRNLQSLTIGRYTDTIMQSAFKMCTALQTINYNADSCHYMGNVENNYLRGCFGSTDTNVATLNIGSNVKSIPDYAFHDLSNLSNVNLPSSLHYIGSYAFTRTSIPGHLVIPDSVRYIGWCAFWNIKTITAITIGRYVDTIDYTAFHACYNLTTVYYNADNCRYMGISLGDAISAPFINDTNLRDLYIGQNVKSIPNCAFANQGGYGLRNIHLGDSLINIGNQAFQGTALIDTIILPRNLEQIGERAFFNCDSMTAVVIGGNVTSIGQQAFGHCDNLRSITLYAETPPLLGSNAFSSTPDNKTIHVPCGTIADYTNAWGYYNYSTPEINFQVTVLSDNNTMGSAMMVSQHINCADSSIIVRANENYHYHFVAWSNDRTSNPDTLYLSSDTTVTALFAPDHYQLSITVNDTIHGSATGAGEYSYLDTVLLSAIATEHYHFSYWDIGWQTYYDNPHQHIVTGNANITAYFTIDQHQIVAVSSDEMKGVVSGGGNYNYGSPCTLTASAYTGYHFVGWSNGQTANPYSFPVLEDVELTALFIEDGAQTHTITVASADPSMGKATINGESSATVEDGDTVTITATANEGYHFMRWDDNDINATRTVTATSDTTFTAYFEANGGTEGIGDVDGMKAKVYSANGQIVVENADGLAVTLYDAAGRILATKHSAIQTIPFDVPTSGTYLVKVGNAPARRIVVVR